MGTKVAPLPVWHRLWHLIIDNWQRKLVALFSATIIWMLVNHSLTVVRTIEGIPVKVINLPSDKTIEGLLPSGFLNKKMTLTLGGDKEVIDNLEPSDLLIIVNAQDKGDQWVAHVTKKSLVSLNPEIDLSHSISDVAPNELIIQLTPLVTYKIPIYLVTPTGNPPNGYQFIEIAPKTLYQTISGAEKPLKALQAKGIKLTFDLNKVSLEELNSLPAEDDAVKFYIPKSWKYVTIPFLNNAVQEINDPQAALLHMMFLKLPEPDQAMAHSRVLQ